MGKNLLADFAFVYHQAIAWGDMDAMGHVNNANYFRYFEAARIAYFAGEVKFGWSGEDAVGPILAKIECRFRFPLTYPDDISVGIRVVELGEDRLRMMHRIVSDSHQKIAAEGVGVIVSFNYKTQSKTAIPAHVRDNILALDNPTPFEF